MSQTKPLDKHLHSLAITSALEHGQMDNPDHEVGDLQDMLALALELVPKDKLDTLAIEFNSVNDCFSFDAWNDAR